MVVRRHIVASAALLSLALTGCHHHKSYDEERPDMTKLSQDDSGLQSKDVIAASDQMARDLLTDPRLNNSTYKWTIAVGHFIDATGGAPFGTNYDIFIERLRTDLSERSGGRIALIENRDTFNQLNAAEREGSAPPPAPISPDYMLYGKAFNLPNRSTDYFLLQFDLTNLNTREQVWSRKYEVKTSRD